MPRRMCGKGLRAAIAADQLLDDGVSGSYLISRGPEVGLWEGTR